jgi:hypothetical protein
MKIVRRLLLLDWSIPYLGLVNSSSWIRQFILIHSVLSMDLSILRRKVTRLERDMIYVSLNALLLCLAILRRIILPASLILCFGTLPSVQVANAQSPAAVFSCPSGFALSGSCGVGDLVSGGSGDFAIVGTQNGTTPTVSGGQAHVLPGTNGHVALSLMYQKAQVNVQQFQTTFTFVPNGLNNFNGKKFSAGAGCEAGVFQAFAQVAPPNNVFEIVLDQCGALTVGSSTFTYSSVQYYAAVVSPPNAPNPPGQSPCNPNLGGTDFTYVGVN